MRKRKRRTEILRVWSKGLGRVELAADLKKVRVLYDGNAILLTGKTEPPVSWEFVVVLSSTELWPMMKLVVSNAGRRFFTKWLKLRLFDNKAMAEGYRLAIKTRPGAKPEIEYAGIIQEPQKSVQVVTRKKTNTQEQRKTQSAVIVAPTVPTKASLQDIRNKYYDLARTALTNQKWFHEWFRYATAEPYEAVDFIMKEIVMKNRCLGCAACVQVCPVNVFDFVGDKPADRRHASCVFCGMCAAVCPPARLGERELSSVIVNGNARDEGFGRYRTAVLARSRDPEVLLRAQDGGVVTTLLIHALNEGIIDAVITGDTAKGQTLRPVPRLATTREQLLSCAGSRYTYSPNTVKFREAYDKDLRVALVGVPCQINGLRYSQTGETADFDFTSWFRHKVVFTVGLFCSEVFTAKGLDDLSMRTKIPLSEIANINVKGKVISKTKDGNENISSLKEMRKFMRQECNNCWDYSAELADISCGGIGQKGWTFTVPRTEIGQSLYEKMLEKNQIEVRAIEEEAQNSKDLLVKLCAQKKVRPKLGKPSSSDNLL